MKSSDRNALAELYDEHVWGVYGFFGYRVASRAEAEDLTQLTFERAVRSWQRFDEERGSQRTWLMAIARNLLIDHYRLDRSDVTRSLEEDAVRRKVEVPPETDDDLGVSLELANALSELKPRDQEIVALRFGGDLTGPEIAELTGLSLANVQQILSRSLRTLRERLEPSLRAVG